MRRISMATWNDLVAATPVRYWESSRAESGRILDAFSATTGYHRKHAIRLLRGNNVGASPASSRPGRRRYDDAVRAALIVLWEAGDRICGKRLKALLPILVPAMERHGHLTLDAEVPHRRLVADPRTSDTTRAALISLCP